MYPFLGVGGICRYDVSQIPPVYGQHAVGAGVSRTHAIYTLRNAE